MYFSVNKGKIDHLKEILNLNLNTKLKLNFITGEVISQRKWPPIRIVCRKHMERKLCCNDLEREPWEMLNYHPSEPGQRSLDPSLNQFQQSVRFLKLLALHWMSSGPKWLSNLGQGSSCHLKVWLPSWRSSKVIYLPMQEMQVQSLGGEDPLEKEMASHSSVLAWRMWATVHRVTKNQTWLSNQTTTYRNNKIL